MFYEAKIEALEAICEDLEQDAVELAEKAQRVHGLAFRNELKVDAANTLQAVETIHQALTFLATVK